MFWGNLQPGSTTSDLTGVMRRRSGLFSTVFNVLHSAVIDTPMYRSSSRFFKKHRYFSSFRDSLVLTTAKKWFLPTNQSPRQLYSTTGKMKKSIVNQTSLFRLKTKNCWSKITFVGCFFHPFTFFVGDVKLFVWNCELRSGRLAGFDLGIWMVTFTSKSEPILKYKIKEFGYWFCWSLKIVLRASKSLFVLDRQTAKLLPRKIDSSQDYIFRKTKWWVAADQNADCDRRSLLLVLCLLELWYRMLKN